MGHWRPLRPGGVTREETEDLHTHTFATRTISRESLLASTSKRTVTVGTISVLVTRTRFSGTLIYICWSEMINSWVISISTSSFLFKACIVKWAIGTLWQTLASCSISSESLFTSAAWRTIGVDTNCILIAWVGIWSTLIDILCVAKRNDCENDAV